MPLILEVPPEVEAQLREVAQQRGTDISSCIFELILKGVLEIRDVAPDRLTLDEAAQMLATSATLVTRMLERGDLASLHPAIVLAEKRRREAVSRAMDAIVEITEELKLYDHQRVEL